jgi:hypothetical protein
MFNKQDHSTPDFLLLLWYRIFNCGKSTNFYPAPTPQLMPSPDQWHSGLTLKLYQVISDKLRLSWPNNQPESTPISQRQQLRAIESTYTPSCSFIGGCGGVVLVLA